MRKIVFQSRIVRADLRTNPHVLYVFGDNEGRRGYGGLAAHCRGEPNAVGIATKKSACTQEACYWTEEDTERQNAIVRRDMEPLFAHNGVIVLPAMGIGTGLAQLHKRAPSTFQYMEQLLASLEDDDR